MTGAGDGNLRVGKTVSDAFGMVAGNFGKLLVYVLIGGLLTALATHLFGAVRFVQNPDGEATVTFGFHELAGLLLFSVLALLFGALQSGMMAIFRHALERRPVSFADSLRGAADNALANGFNTFILWFASGFAALFLLVPAIAFSVIFFVVKPVAFGRKAGLSNALGISSDLTAGSRWKILGATALTGVVLLVLVLVGMFILLTISNSIVSLGGSGSSAAAVLITVALLMVPVWLAFAVWTSLQMTIHATLVSLESGQGDSMGEVFD